MIQYIAFLRSINVSGQKTILLDVLNEIFISFGFSDVKTYVQSGNVLFSSNEENIIELRIKIGEELKRVLGYRVVVIIKTLPEIEEIINNNPFKPYEKNKNLRNYVTFLLEKPANVPKLPFFNHKSDIQVIGYFDNTVYTLGLPAGNGKYGFPNNFIEKEFKTLATTRNFNTIFKFSSKNQAISFS